MADRVSITDYLTAPTGRTILDPSAQRIETRPPQPGTGPSGGVSNRRPVGEYVSAVPQSPTPSEQFAEDAPAFARGLAVEAPARIAGMAGALMDAGVWGYEEVQDLFGDWDGEYEQGFLPSSISEALAGKTRKAIQGALGTESLAQPGEPGYPAQEAGAGAGLVLGTAPMGWAQLGRAGTGQLARTGVGQALRRNLARGATTGLEMGGTALVEGGMAQLREQMLEESDGELSALQELALVGPSIILSPMMAGGAMRAGQRVTEKVDDMSKALRATGKWPRGVKTFMKNRGFTEDQALRYASEVRAQFGFDPEDPEKFADQALDLLRRTVDELEEGEQYSTRQILDAAGDAGQAIAGLDEYLAANNTFYKTQRLGQYQNSIESLSNRLAGVLEGVSPEETFGAFDQLRSQRWRNVQKAWRAIPKSKMPKMRTASIRRTANRIQNESVNPGDVPQEVRTILNDPRWAGDEVDWETWQRMRSRIMLTQRKGQGKLADDVAAQRANSLTPLKSRFDAQLTAYTDEAGRSGELYADALRGTREYYQDFDTSTKLIQGLDDFDPMQADRFVGFLLGSKKPTRELRQFGRLADQNPVIAAGVRDMLVDRLTRNFFEFTDDGVMRPRPGQANNVLKQLRNNEAQLRGYLGDTYDALVKTMNSAKKAATSRAGKTAAAMSTRSSQNTIGDMFLPQGQVATPVTMEGRLANAALDKILGTPDVEMMNHFLAEFVKDPQFAIRSLEVPASRAMPGWVLNWDQLVKRARSRGAIQYFGRDGEGQEGVR